MPGTDTKRVEILGRLQALAERIRTRNEETTEANRQDELEMAPLYAELGALLVTAPSASNGSRPANRPQERPAQNGAFPEAEPSAPLPPEATVEEPPKAEKVEPVVLGKQDTLLAMLHTYPDAKIDAAYMSAAMYPDDPPNIAYKKLYATLDAMVRSKRLEKVKGDSGRWRTLKQRDPRPIKLPNGEILEAVV